MQLPQKLLLLSNTPEHVFQILSDSGFEVSVYRTNEIKDWEAFLDRLEKGFGRSTIYGFVYNFGKIIPSNILRHLRLINIHYSLLPKYRGADPVAAALLNGDEYTGITLHWVVPELDAGDILLQKRYKIPEDFNKTKLFAFLEKRLSEILHDFFATPDWWKLQGEPQRGIASYAFKFDKSAAFLALRKLTAHEIVRRVLAFNNTPGTWTKIYFCKNNNCKNKTGLDEVRDLLIREFRIKKVALVRDNIPLKPGEIHWSKKLGLIVGTLLGNLAILEGGISGKKELRERQFLSLKGKIISFV